MEKKILTVTLNPAIDYTVSVPEFESGRVNIAEAGRRDAGGKGINAASVTSQYRLETAVTGFLGTGNSRIFIEHFEKFRLHDRFIYIDGPTREGIKITDPKRQITTDINFPGFTITPGHLDQFRKTFSAVISEYDYVILSGSIPLNVPDDIYAELAEKASAAGVFCVVDTSGEPLRLAVESGFTDLIKPNLEELAGAFGTVGTDLTEELTSHILSKVGMIALTLGEKGSRLYTADGVYDATAPEVNAVSTVGAGDSFLAGLVTGFAQGQSAPEALKLAAATAASKLTKAGAGWSDTYPPGGFYEQINITFQGVFPG